MTVLENDMGSNVFITTHDNPFDPFTEFKHWFEYDILHGYNTCEYLARVAATSSQMSDAENEEEIERSIDEIIRLDFMGIYKKVKFNS